MPETFLRTGDPQQVNRTDQNPLLSGDWQKKKGHERTFWGEVIFCILVSLGYRGICVCKNLLNDTLDIYACHSVLTLLPKI